MSCASESCEVIAILAEDVRAELGGKHTIIGAFSGDILLPAFPASFKIAAYLVLRFKDKGDHVVDLEVKLDDAPLGTSTTGLDTREALTVVLVIPMGIVTVDHPQTFSIAGVIDGGEKRMIISTSIALAPLGTPFPPS